MRKTSQSKKSSVKDLDKFGLQTKNEGSEKKKDAPL